MTDSQQLLAEYARNGSESAFRELVTRYFGLVYSTALRLVGGDTHLAEDVAQTVFSDLARKARGLSSGVLLGGWLHQRAYNVAAPTMRAQRRRQSREREAAQMNALQDDSGADLAQVAPVLDEAIMSLGAEDRTAIMLCFFERRDFRAIGQALGSSEDAARMRVTRALDKLHTLLTHRGVTLSVAALGTALATEAVAAVPAGLAGSVAGAALTSAAAGGGVTATLAKLMTLANLKVGIISLLVVAGVATPLAIQYQSQARLREENQGLRQQVNQAAAAAAENERLSNLVAQAKGAELLSREQMSELLRLRGEVGLLRRESKELEALQAQNQQLRKQSDESRNNQGTNKPPIVAKIVIARIKQPQEVSEEQIRTNLSVKAGDIFDRAAVDRDVRNLHGTGLFCALRAADSLSKEGVLLNYLLQERPKVAKIGFNGNTKFPDADLSKLISSRVGQSLNDQTLIEDAQRIKELYANSGFSTAEVRLRSNVNEDLGVAEVIFEVLEHF